MPRQPDNNPRVRDTVFMSGWLFADLLLALAVLFLAANTIGIKIPPPPPPKLIVTPTHLYPTSSNCKSHLSQYQCIVTLTETADSQGDINWAAVSDISSGLVFTPSSRPLSPGTSINIQISHIPCENDSFTFSGSRGAIPVRMLWQCHQIPNNRILEHNFCPIKLNIGNPDIFINDDVKSARAIIEPQLNQQQFLKGRQVGIAIAYGGADDGGQARGTQVATQVYNVIRSIAKDKQAQTYNVFNPTSLYEPLFTGFQDPNTAIINVYLVVRSANSGETCGTNT